MFRYMTPRLSKHNLPITFSTHFISQASNYYLFPNKPLILYLLDFMTFFFPVQNAFPIPGLLQVQAQQGSHPKSLPWFPQLGVITPSLMVSKDFTCASVPELITHHFFSCNTVFSQITENPYLIHPTISKVPYISLAHSQ